MMRVGVIGYGYWGPNLVRNFMDSDAFQVAAICDAAPNRLTLAQKRCPGVKTFFDWREMIADSAVDVVAVSTPVSTHFEMGMAALRAGKHVLIEKPLATSADDCARLLDEAAKRKLVLMVDHTFVYTSAVRKIKELVDDGSLGQVYYYDSVRINLGLFQHDVNVIWDLAVHDLAIMDYVLPGHPVAVSATGVSHVPGGNENIAYLTVFFDNSLLAHLHVNWLAPVKLRTTLLGGSRKMIVYDDLQPSEKIKVYDRGITVNTPSEDGIYQMRVGYRTGDVWSPNLETTEALKVELAHMADCIRDGSTPLTSGEAGLNVVQIMEAASASMKTQGRPVELSLLKASV